MDAMRDERWYDERVRRMFVARGLRSAGGYVIDNRTEFRAYAYIGDGYVVLPNGLMVGSKQVESVTVNTVSKRVTMDVADEADILRTVSSDARTGWFMSRTAPYIADETPQKLMPDTVYEIEEVFDHEWPGWRDEVALNDAAGCVVVPKGTLGARCDIQLSDATVSDLHADVCRELRERDYAGTMPYKKSVAVAVENAGLQNEANPVGERMRAVEWDGVPRAERWLERAFGASAEEYGLSEDESRRYVRAASLAWLTGLAERQSAPSRITAVPVLVRGRREFIEDRLSVTALGMYERVPDKVTSVYSFTASARGLLIAGMTMDALRGMDAYKRRNLLVEGSDKYWSRYAKESTEIPRRFGIVATSDTPAVFTEDMEDDVRRFFPVHCDESRAEPLERVAEEAEQVWAEVFAMMGDGASSRLFDDPELSARVRDAAHRPVDWEDCVLAAMGPRRDDDNFIITRDDVLAGMTRTLSDERAVARLDAWSRSTRTWETLCNRNGETVYRRRRS